MQKVQECREAIVSLLEKLAKDLGKTRNDVDFLVIAQLSLEELVSLIVQLRRLCGPSSCAGCGRALVDDQCSHCKIMAGLPAHPNDDRAAEASG